MSNIEDKKLHLVIVTPYGKFYEGNVDFVAFPASDGERGVLPNVAPFVAAIYPGSLRFRIEDEWSYAFVSNGYAQAGHTYVVVICNAAEFAGDIDLERAKSNLEKNVQRLDQDNLDKLHKNIYEHSVRRNSARIKVYESFQHIQTQAAVPLSINGLSPKAADAQII